MSKKDAKSHAEATHFHFQYVGAPVTLLECAYIMHGIDFFAV